LEGYEEAFGEMEETKSYGDYRYEWKYGQSVASVNSYKIGDTSSVVKKKPEYAFRTAESFLSNLNKTKNENVDVSIYRAGQRVFHKKFGEGKINYVEQEGDDMKVDITFDKIGHKRLMAKFAGLEIID
ncbi:hypothetical protein IKE96_01905, partial [bacterium]|nr:hypothetical protein [bacterium]